ncbi:LOW QUALITY PROTEIN: hypothetical protein ElyMa_004219500 [Elysia marginata]|uniref:Uncharacterized protein n=1 Tax=Elysia marginata TaxID=1093978 RepID=A0AAV4GPZ9_9GAST|nr:LOW QUALITY PROTEIN: hypothetical protein ElyMa_004219500 [Elysia marginata]
MPGHYYNTPRSGTHYVPIRENGWVYSSESSPAGDLDLEFSEWEGHYQRNAGYKRQGATSHLKKEVSYGQKLRQLGVAPNLVEFMEKLLLNGDLTFHVLQIFTSVIPRRIQDQVIQLTRKFVGELQEGDEGALYSGRGGWSSPEREYRPCRDRSEGRASSQEGYDGYERTRYVSPERRYRSRGKKSYDPAVHCREYAGYESVRYTSPERECKPSGDRLEGRTSYLLEGRTSYLGGYDRYERTRYVSPEKGYGTWRERSHDRTVDLQKYAGYEKARSSPERVHRPWGNKSRDRAVDIQEYGGYKRTRYVSRERGYGTRRERSHDRIVDLQEYAGYEKARSSPERVYRSWGNKSRDRPVNLEKYGDYERARYVSPDRECRPHKRASYAEDNVSSYRDDNQFDSREVREGHNTHLYGEKSGDNYNRPTKPVKQSSEDHASPYRGDLEGRKGHHRHVYEEKSGDDNYQPARPVNQPSGKGKQLKSGLKASAREIETANGGFSKMLESAVEGCGKKLDKTMTKISGMEGQLDKRIQEVERGKQRADSWEHTFSTRSGGQPFCQEAVHSVIHNVPGVVENLVDEHIERKPSEIQAEESKSSETLISGSLLGREMPLKSREPGAPGSHPKVEGLAKSLGSSYSCRNNMEDSRPNSQQGRGGMHCIQGRKIHLWFKKVDKVGPLKGLLLCQVRSVSREGGWDFSPCVSSISTDKMRQGKGVVEKANEQLKPKLSGIQREEAKYRNAILSESPQGKEVPRKIVKTVASGSLLRMGNL